MKKAVYDYFKDLNKSDLDIVDGAFVRSLDKIKIVNFSKLDLVKCEYAGTEYFLKKWADISAVNSLVFSSVYNDAGVLTPPIYPTVPSPKDEHDFDYLQNIWTIQQSVTSLDKPIIHIGGEFNESLYKHKLSTQFSKSRWGALIDTTTRDVFLKFMTEECLDQLVNMFLLDELKTEVDRHPLNYFLYSNTNNGLYDGVIAIDLESSRISYKSNRKTFEQTIDSQYSAFTPIFTIDHFSVAERISTIQELLQSGKLSPSNIATLKSAIAHDLPTTIRRTLDIPVIKNKIPQPNAQKYYDTYCQLWDYHRETLGKELEI